MIKKTVRFALLLQDDYSGANIIGGGYLFRINGVPVRPVAKPEGYYVFTDIPGERLTVTVESARYWPIRFEVKPDTLNPADPVAVARLYRKYRMGFADCDWVTGTLAPGLLAVSPAEEELTLKSLTGENGAGVLKLQGYTVRNFSGARISVGKGKTKELFAVKERYPDGSYRLDHPPGRRHKEGEPVLQVYCGPCDEHGCYGIPIPYRAREKIQKAEGYDEEADMWVF